MVSLLVVYITSLSVLPPIVVKLIEDKKFNSSDFVIVNSLCSFFVIVIVTEFVLVVRKFKVSPTIPCI